MSGRHRKERGEYRGIYVSIADDFDFLPLHHHSKLILYTLKMKLGMSGIGVAGPGKIADLTGIPFPEIDGALQELAVTQWIKRDGHVIWIRNGLRCDPHYNPNNRFHIVPIMKYLAGLPQSKLIGEFCEYYGFDPAWIEHGVPPEFPNVDKSTPHENANSGPSTPNQERRREGEVGEKEITPKGKRLAWRFCPDDWEPTEKHVRLSADLGVDLPTEVEKFRDHEYKTPKTDPDRAFSTWLRNAQQWGGSKTKGKASIRLHSKADETTEYLRSRGIAS